MNQHETMSMEQVAMRVSKTSILVNTLLSLAKLAAGILASSEAMVSDAVHSASDVFSTFVVIIGIKMAGKKADKEYPYGHERMECVAAILLSAVLALTGAGIGFSEPCGSGNPCHGGGSPVYCGEGVDVLVHPGKCEKNQFRGADGGCLASPFGFPVFHRRPGGHHRGQAGISGDGSSGKRDHLPVHFPGGL